jgi:hypothetical protein
MKDIPSAASVWVGETDGEGIMTRVYFQTSSDLILLTLAVE